MTSYYYILTHSLQVTSMSFQNQTSVILTEYNYNHLIKIVLVVELADCDLLKHLDYLEERYGIIFDYNNYVRMSFMNTTQNKQTNQVESRHR